MRIVLGALVVALAFSGAVWLHEGLRADAYYRAVALHGGPGISIYQGGALTVPDHRRAGWQDPLAAALAIVGIAAGVAIAGPSLRRRPRQPRVG